MSYIIKKSLGTFLNTVVSILVVFAVLGVMYSTQVEKVESDTSDNLSGYAWSSNIGWISMNCTNSGTCPTSDYGVNVDAAGNLSGYAWSSNIGWISFQPTDVSGCLSGPCPATMDSNTGVITGWARALAGGTANSGGWDGFIKLGGSGLIVTGCNWSGYAWGSDVVGWISFSGTAASGDTYGVVGSGDACVQPSGDISATGCDIAIGESSCPSDVSWTTSNFRGTPSVRLEGVQFSTSADGPSSELVKHGSNIFTLVDIGPPVTDVKDYTLNIGCVDGADWATGAGTCLKLPTVTILTDSDLVRNGQKADLDIEITSDSNLECKLYGAALTPISFNHVAPATVGETENYPYLTLSLTSAQVVRVECEMPGSPAIAGSDEKRINVTATIEER